MGIFPHELRGIIHHEAVGEVIEAVHNVFFALVFETFLKFLVAGRVAMDFIRILRYRVEYYSQIHRLLCQQLFLQHTSDII